jgi:nitrile hydratase accessory protein
MSGTSDSGGREVGGGAGGPPAEGRETDALVAGMDGEAALPRRNGELVFAAPWEGRVFGLAVTLHEGRCYEWEDFRRRLIAAIARRERELETPWSYYDCWLEAFEDLVVERGLLGATEIEARAAEYASGARDEF